MREKYIQYIEFLARYLYPMIEMKLYISMTQDHRTWKNIFRTSDQISVFETNSPLKDK